MNTEIKNKWVTALRSGLYDQGQQRLLTNDGKFCCLGVLCDIYIKETGDGAWDTEDGNFVRDGVYTMGALPYIVGEWAGTSGFVMMPDGRNENLAYLNDVGRTFEEIADLIEEKL